MKFKRLAAFVLTAALSVSSVGMTAFAATATLKTSNDCYEKRLIITLNHDTSDLSMNGSDYHDADDGSAELNKTISDLGIGDPSGGELYKFVGWSVIKPDSNADYDSFYSDADATATTSKFKDVFKSNSGAKLGDFVTQRVGSRGQNATNGTNGTAIGKDSVSKGDTIILYPVFRRWASQTEKDDYDAQKAADSKANDDENRWKSRRSTQVGKLTTDITKNNVNNTTDKKIETQQISRQPVLNAETSGVTTKNRKYTAADIKNIKDYLGVDDNDIYFFYNVKFSDDKYELIPGKKAVVTLNTRDEKNSKNLNYSLRDGARVFVYRITETGKVKVTDYKQGSNFVSFVTDELGLYAMVILPKGATAMGYDNPPTGEGDVLPVAMLAVSAIGASCLLTVKKRKEIEA